MSVAMVFAFLKFDRSLIIAHSLYWAFTCR